MANDYGFNRREIRGGSTARNISDLAEIKDELIEVAKAALAEGAEIVVAEAKRRCPVKTGKLRDSIHATKRKQGLAYSVSAGAYRTDSRGRKYYYGAAVEFNPEINKPFLNPAVDACSAEVYNKIETAIRNEINNRR